MDTARIAHPRTPDTRELRALKLYEERGHEIVRLAPDVFRVPSQDGERSYDVLYGEREECPCPDHQYRHVACVHLYAVGISIAKGRFVHPEVLAGDPFAYAAGRSAACACFERVVYVGHLVAGEDGGEVEAFEAVPCRSCRKA